MDENVIVVSHVDTEVDADCAVAALSDSGINAAKQYRNAPGGSTLFAMPGGMGFGSAGGYDILVVKSAEKEAREILIGAGFAEPTEEEAAAEPEENGNTEIAAEEAEEAQPQEAAASKGSGLMVLLFLIAAALFVIGVDRLIELIKSLF